MRPLPGKNASAVRRVLAVVLTAALAGCSFGSGTAGVSNSQASPLGTTDVRSQVPAPQTSTATATTFVLPVPSVSPNPNSGREQGGTIKLVDSVPPALARYVTPVATVEELWAGESMGVIAPSAEGELLVASGVQATDPSSIPPQRIGIYTLATGQVDWIRPKPPPSQGSLAWDGDIDADWVVWVEGRSTELTALDFVLYSFSRHTRKITRVASSVLRDGKAVSIPGYNRPQIIGDRVIWQDIASPDAKVTALYSRPLDGSAPARIEARGALFANKDQCSATQPGGPPTSVVYQQIKALGGPQADKRTVQIRRRVVSGPKLGSDAVLTTVTMGVRPEQTVSAVAACQDTIAYAVINRPLTPSSLGTGRTQLVITGRGFKLTVQPRGDSSVGDLVVGRDLVALTTVNPPLDGNQWAIDLRARRAWQLPVAPGGGNVQLAGDYIRWREPARGRWFDSHVGRLTGP